MKDVTKEEAGLTEDLHVNDAQNAETEKKVAQLQQALKGKKPVKAKAEKAEVETIDKKREAKAVKELTAILSKTEKKLVGKTTKIKAKPAKKEKKPKAPKEHKRTALAIDCNILLVDFPDNAKNTEKGLEICNLISKCERKPVKWSDLPLAAEQQKAFVSKFGQQSISYLSYETVVEEAKKAKRALPDVLYWLAHIYQGYIAPYMLGKGGTCLPVLFKGICGFRPNKPYIVLEGNLKKVMKQGIRKEK